MSGTSRRICAELFSLSADHYDVVRWYCPKCNGIRGSCMARALKEELRLQSTDAPSTVFDMVHPSPGPNGRVWVH